ncbi:MAG: hypothetical protein R3B90_00540 [Planctomycetaceae bacterium]
MSGLARTTLGLAACLVASGGATAMAQHYQQRPVYRPQVIIQHQHHQHHPQTTQLPAYPQTFTYGARSHLEALSNDLQNQANAIAWDMYENYRSSPGYRETYRETYKLLQDAKHIHQLVWEEQYHHQHHEQDHIAADLAEIDQLFHHIEEDIANWRPARYNPYHNAGLLHQKIEQFEETLHHLMTDYGVNSQFGQGEAPPPGGGPGSPPPPAGGFGPGVPLAP